MIVATELKAFLDALGTVGSMRIGAMDASPDVAGTIYEYGGQKSEGQFGVAGIKYEKPAVQIMFRGAPNDYSGPMIKARIAWAALAAIQPGTITSGGSIFLTLEPQQSPFSLGKDANQRYEIVCNFYIKKEL